MKIIHVDMNKYARYAMEKDIKELVPNAELHCFNAPDPALAFAKAHGCDVLITEIDLWLEELAGFRLAKAIQELNPQVNIIFVTVSDEYETARELSRELSELNVSGLIPKPWNINELAAVFGNLSLPL